MLFRSAPLTVKEKLEKDKDRVCFLDVRSEGEFSTGHVPGAVCVPLEQIESGKAVVPKDRFVVLSCQSGARSAKAREILRSRGYENVAELEGGFSAWRGAGFPVSRLRRGIPVIRQVMLVAGLLVFAGTLLGMSFHAAFLFLPLFVGAGLAMAGATGWCPMALLLERMPWNRIQQL